MTATRAYILAALVFVLDQLSKLWVVNGLELERLGSVPLIPSLSLTWVENTGVAMGMLEAGGEDIARWGLVVLTAAIALAIIWWINSERDDVDLAAMGLILGGAIGNIVDRARLGYVIDFVHFYIGDWSFYVFNIADAGISVGVAVLLLRAFLWPDGQKRSQHGAAVDPPGK